MLQLQKGKCENCEVQFSDVDTVQSTNVQCSKCAKERILCQKCKDEYCDCGGKYLNVFDRRPDLLH